MICDKDKEINGYLFAHKMNMAGSFPWQRCSPVLPASLAKYPQTWTKEEVGVWLRWCADEYSIEPVQSEKFDLNGKALCLLSRSDFMERVPKNGDVLYNCLQSLMTKHTGEALPTGLVFVPPHSSISSSVSHTTMPCLSRSSFVPIRPHAFINLPSRRSPEDSAPSMLRPALPQPDPLGFAGSSSILDPLPGQSLATDHIERSSECRLLWEFIYQLLSNNKYSSYICWEDKEEYVFRIINPTGLAELWGQQKNRTNMTYEKLSRALRYYYRMNIIKKVPGKRLTYRFLQPPTTIQKGQRGAKPHYKMQMELVSGKTSTRFIKQEKENTENLPSTSSGAGYRLLAVEESSETSEKDFDEDSDLEKDTEWESETELTEKSGVGSGTSGKESEPMCTEANTASGGTLEAAGTLDATNVSTSSHQSRDFSQYETRLAFRSAAVQSVPRPPGIKLENPFCDLDSQQYVRFFAPSAQPSVSEIRPEFSRNFPRMRLGSERYIRGTENMYRSFSCEFAQSLYSQRFFPRPQQPRSASPRTEFQQEPEDLSMRTRSQSSTAPPSETPQSSTTVSSLKSVR